MSMRMSIGLRLGCLLVAGSWLLAGAGCATGPRASSIDSALDAYRAGRYEVAVHDAESAMEGASGVARGEAAYVAGLAAYRGGELATAARHLETARSSPDRRTAASACATLGLVRLEQGRSREAGDLFAEAYPRLDDDDARRAAEHAVLAFRQAGDDRAAARWASVTGAAAGSSAAAPAARGFSLQVGAFRDRGNAHEAAAAAEADARRVANGPARIVADAAPDGGTRYVVQFGDFASRTAADAARRSLGRLEYIVAPAIR